MRRTSGRVLLLAGLAVLLAISTASAEPAHTRDPDLQFRPHNLGDLFVADQYEVVPGTNNARWFCDPAGNSGNKVCSRNSMAALQDFWDIAAAQSYQNLPTLLRAGKARDDCVNTWVGRYCGTGVPPTPSRGLDSPCGTPYESAYCGLWSLKAWGVKLGVVVGSRDGDTHRSLADVALQACQIHIQQKDDYKSPWGDGRVQGMYDFLFLDQARYFGEELPDIVRYLSKGMTMNASGAWAANPACQPGWDVITNDNGWPNKSIPLARWAWGHARHLNAAESISKLESAAAGNPVLYPEDNDFLDAVHDLDAPQEPATGTATFSPTTGPVLRLEIPTETSNFAQITRLQQCRLLRDWADLQDDKDFAFIFPFYNAGLPADMYEPYNFPYDSFLEATARDQFALVKSPNVKPPGCNGA